MERRNHSTQVFQLLPCARQFLFIAGADGDLRSKLRELFRQRQPRPRDPPVISTVCPRSSASDARGTCAVHVAQP